MKHLIFIVASFILCFLVVVEGHAQSGFTSTVSVTIRLFTATDSTAVRNYAVALYDSSGIKIDSLVALDTNVVTFANVPITSVHSPDGLPEGYLLEQNYPNPFNPTTRIQFSVVRGGAVSLTTYTVLGQTDASLAMMAEPGTYEIEYEPGGAAGVVFYRLTTKDFSETRKMIQFGGPKSGRSGLTLRSSAMRYRTERPVTIAESQANNLTVKLYNLPWTYPSIMDTTVRITEVTGDTTVSVYARPVGGLPCPGTPTVDYAGKTYNTVQIGSQCWLKENLDVGDMILGSQNPSNPSVIEKYCHADNAANCITYGGLYQWNEAMQYSTTPGAQGICPSGWHIPTLEQFQTLGAYVGSDGNSLKAIGQGSGAGAGTDLYGFSALLAGYRNYNGAFGYLGGYATMWSSTEYNAPYAHGMYLDYHGSSIYFGSYYFKYYRFSVRCLKD